LPRERSAAAQKNSHGLRVFRVDIQVREEGTVAVITFAETSEKNRIIFKEPTCGGHFGKPVRHILE
jgi:hypothetical protein